MQSVPQGVNSLPLLRPVLAVDIGGTWTRVAWAGSDGLREVRRAPTPGGERAALGDGLVALIGRLADEITRIGLPSPTAVGVSATGPVDIATGSLFSPPNAAGLAGVALGQELARRLGLPVNVDRDTNAALLAEHAVGAATGADNAVYLTVSTGVGGAVLLGGRLLRGADGVAGEVGHVVVASDGPPCGCGRSGCLEAMASGFGLGRAATRSARSDPGSGLGRLLAQRVASGEDQLTGSDVATSAAAGDAVARRLLDAAGEAVVSAAVDLVNVFNPNVLIIGGTIARANPQWIAQARDAVRVTGLYPAGSTVHIRSAQLGEHAELIGAALQATQAG